MNQFAVLGSGSKANSYAFKTSSGLYLFDAGFTLKELKKRMALCGWNALDVKALWLTHAHADHAKGAEALLNYSNAAFIYPKGLKLKQVIKGSYTGESLEIEPLVSQIFEDVEYYAFETYHDSVPCVGYHFKVGGLRYTLMTDTGKTDPRMLALAARSDILFLESNYCLEQLKNGPYPLVLQKRIDSDHGHLSNEQTREFLDDLWNCEQLKLQKVYLVHLSENNNTIDQVRDQVINRTLFKRPIEICPRNELVKGD